MAAGGGGAACAACKYQRRRCTAECPLAQYFPHDRPRLFRNAHRLFGVSNILKTLSRVGPDRHREAMRCIIYEANAWEACPTGGCVPAIIALNRQVQQAEQRLHRLHALIRAYRAALGADDGDPSSATSSPAPPLLQPAGTDNNHDVLHHAAYGGVLLGYGDQELMMMTNDTTAPSSQDGIAAAASLQAPWMQQPQYYDMTSNAVVDMPGTVPQPRQDDHQDHQFLVDTTMMIPQSQSQSQSQQQYSSSNPVQPEPYDNEMSSYFVNNIDEEMPHESSTDSSKKKAMKAPKMEGADGLKDAATCFKLQQQTREK